MNQDFSLFEQRLIEAGYDSDAIEQILEVAKNSIYPKKYGLVWEEKTEMIKENLKLQIPYLEELEEREIKLVEPNSPQHLLIEGDNYEALKLLQTTHRGKINVIYIDPPYNTGNQDFKYNDRYLDKDDAWKHSYWLSFMHKRLILAKELMSEDGVIFISIDDNEMAQLKLLCDEIFGEINFQAAISVVKKRSGKENTSNFLKAVEYILVYSKQMGIKLNEIPISEQVAKTYNKVDKESGRNYKQVSLRKGGKHDTREERPLSYYPFYFNPNTNELSLEKQDNFIEIFPIKANGVDGTWRWGKTKAKKDICDLIAQKNSKGNYEIYEKCYIDKNGERTMKVKTIWDSLEFVSDKGTHLIKDIFGDNIFTNPKPLSLLKEIIKLHPNEEAIILDFFAGSGTTGHAVLELNQEDGGNRQFILCTNNENNICEDVTYERLKRVMNGYTTPKGKEVEGLPANLKYLKVGMVEKETYTDEDLSYLYIPHVLPLLQLKHSAFHLVSETKHGWVFEGDGFRFGLADPLATKRDFDRLKEQLETYEGEKILYLFSTDTKSYPKYKQLASLEEFIKPIPREMLELLKGE